MPNFNYLSQPCQILDFLAQAAAWALSQVHMSSGVWRFILHYRRVSIESMNKYYEFRWLLALIG